MKLLDKIIKIYKFLQNVDFDENKIIFKNDIEIKCDGNIYMSSNYQLIDKRNNKPYSIYLNSNKMEYENVHIISDK